jgi:hypothetical protein
MSQHPIASRRLRNLLAAAVLSSAAIASAHAANLIQNGGFEFDGFETYTPTGWSISEVGQLGGVLATDAWFSSATGYLTVGAASGSYYALLDNFAPSHVALSQSFSVGAQALASATLSFSWFANVQEPATDFAVHASGLDYTAGGTDDANQHIRVDILRASATPFSTAASDVVFSSFLGGVASAGPNGYATASFNLGGLLNANETYQLRFASVGNVGQMQTGIDNVSLTVTPVPEPETYALMLAGLGLLGFAARRRKA